MRRLLVTTASIAGARPKSFSRCFSYFSKTLTVKQLGNPVQVLELESSCIECTNPSQVIVHMLYSPINPADINMIQGVYAVKPEIPFVCGNEGVGKVVEVQSSVSKLKKGDLVIPRKNALGTWRDFVATDSDDWLKVPSEVSPILLSTLMVNPGTAYRMLKDFVKLEPGSVVIQNGANSAVGQAVIQLCKHWGIKSVNIVRNRDDIESLKQALKTMGADYVLTEDELRSTELFKSEGLPKPSLALNCVGGRNALELIKVMGERSTMVTYGGMSKQPLTVPTAAFIFNDITLRGFWMTRWNWDHDKDGKREKFVEELCELGAKGILSSPSHTIVHIDAWKTAIEGATSQQGYRGTKYILSFEA